MSAEGFINNVAQDLPEADARVLAATAPPLGASTFGSKITQKAWATRPNWYVLSSQDHAVSVELQHELVNRLKAHKTELAASHMSLISHPKAVADLILEAVHTVSAN